MRMVFFSKCIAECIGHCNIHFLFKGLSKKPKKVTFIGVLMYAAVKFIATGMTVYDFVQSRQYIVLGR